MVKITDNLFDIGHTWTKLEWKLHNLSDYKTKHYELLFKKKKKCKLVQFKLFRPWEDQELLGTFFFFFFLWTEDDLKITAICVYLFSYYLLAVCQINLFFF